MSILTVYVGLLLRWCNASEVVVRYQTDGRTSPKTRNSIGYFASLVPLRIRIQEDDSLLDVVDRVTAAYCDAHEHGEFAYLGEHIPRSQLLGTPGFNWVSQEPANELSVPYASTGAIRCSPFHFTNPVHSSYENPLNSRDRGEPLILLYETVDQIVGDVRFPLDRFSNEMVERFALNFLLFINRLLSESRKRVKDIPLP